jgi:hypothetical protein
MGAAAASPQMSELALVPSRIRRDGAETPALAHGNVPNVATRTGTHGRNLSMTRYGGILLGETKRSKRLETWYLFRDEGTGYAGRMSERKHASRAERIRRGVAPPATIQRLARADPA